MIKTNESIPQDVWDEVEKLTAEEASTIGKLLCNGGSLTDNCHDLILTSERRNLKREDTRGIPRKKSIQNSGLFNRCISMSTFVRQLKL